METTESLPTPAASAVPHPPPARPAASPSPDGGAPLDRFRASLEPARAAYEEIRKKLEAGEPVGRAGWEKFQMGLLGSGMDLIGDGQSSARVRADALGKCLWAAQQNMELAVREQELEKKQDHDFAKMERQVEISAALANHREYRRREDEWRQRRRDEERHSSLGRPARRHFFDPELLTCAIPLPDRESVARFTIYPDDPPQRGDEFSDESVPSWVKSRTRTLHPDDLPDELYWYGRRPARFGDRQKEPLFKVLTWHPWGAAATYAQTARGLREFPPDTLKAFDLDFDEERCELRLVREEHPPVERVVTPGLER